MHRARPFQSVVSLIDRGIVKAVLSQTLGKTMAKTFDKCQSDSFILKFNETSITVNSKDLFQPQSADSALWPLELIWPFVGPFCQVGPYRPQ